MNETKIFKTYKDFRKSLNKNSNLNGVSEEFAKKNINFKKENETNEG